MNLNNYISLISSSRVLQGSLYSWISGKWCQVQGEFNSTGAFDVTIVVFGGWFPIPISARHTVSHKCTMQHKPLSRSSPEGHQKNGHKWEKKISGKDQPWAQCREYNLSFPWGQFANLSHTQNLMKLFIVVVLATKTLNRLVEVNFK